MVRNFQSHASGGGNIIYPYGYGSATGKQKKMLGIVYCVSKICACRVKF